MVRPPAPFFVAGEGLFILFDILSSRFSRVPSHNFGFLHHDHPAVPHLPPPNVHLGATLRPTSMRSLVRGGKMNEIVPRYASLEPVKGIKPLNLELSWRYVICSPGPIRIRAPSGRLLKLLSYIPAHADPSNSRPRSQPTKVSLLSLNLLWMTSAILTKQAKRRSTDCSQISRLLSVIRPTWWIRRNQKTNAARGV